MTQRPEALPSPEQVIELLHDEFARVGYEVDDVRVETRAKPPQIRVIADGETPLDLDSIAELSHAASALLDAADPGWEPYLLEVSSPGVDRPLTAEKHFRRARGRRVELSLGDGTTVHGRLGFTNAGVVDLVVRAGRGWQVRRLPLSDIRKAVVEVEFSAPSAGELELVGDSRLTADTEAGE